MALREIHAGPFSRIGDRYATFIDSDHFLGRNASADTWLAPANSSKKKRGDGYDLEVYLPGYTRDEIDISVEGDSLEIVAEKSVQDKKYLTNEIPSGRCERRFNLPKTIDRDRIKANLKDGILTISLNTIGEEKPKKVAVL